MILLEFFYSMCWINLIMLTWFVTDAAYSYLTLFNCLTKLRLRFAVYLTTNEDGTFISFLNYESNEPNTTPLRRFLLKLITCPLCLAMWLSILCCLLWSDVGNIAPLYIISIVTFLLLRKSIQILL